MKNVFARSPDEAPQQSKTAGSKMVAFLSRICSMASVHRHDRRLRLCETLSLGEKRFIAVIEYDRKKFLLAGTPQNISLLQRLDDGVEETDPDIVPGIESWISKFSRS